MILPIRNAGQAWARYVTTREDITILEYSAGYELLAGPYAAEWLQRGFDELLRTVRNSEAA